MGGGVEIITFASDKAAQSCQTCKKRKRRCDKGLPTCSLCISKGVPCEYADSPPQFQDGSTNIDARQLQQSKLPNVFFLDHELFSVHQMGVPTPSLSIPPYVQSLLGSNDDIYHATSTYFSSVHIYLPMISRKSFMDLLLNPLLPRRADIALLCLCMQVVIRHPRSLGITEPKTESYLAAKRYLSELESAGVFTTALLQARIVIAMYEIGHAIYPAAYLSIGACAAQGFALRLGTGAGEETSGGRRSWMEEEERRRIWWSIVILERLEHLGSPERPLQTEDPKASDLLPSDIEAWDQGIAAPNYSIDSPVIAETNMGNFARLAHATHLLTQAMRLTRSRLSDSRMKEDQIFQLDRTIRALMEVCKLESERTSLRFCNPLAICSSALLVLHTPSLNIDSVVSGGLSHSLLEFSKIALSDLSCSEVSRFRQNLQFKKVWLNLVSPMVLHSAYQAGVCFQRLIKENPSQEMMEGLQIVKETLAFKNERWTAAGAYLEILQARELMAGH